MNLLLTFPEELLASLPHYLHNIEDYTNLFSCCRRLRVALSNPIPNTLLHLCHAQASTFFRPVPCFLILATARQLGDWARQSTDNEGAFALACQGGLEGLIPLCLDHCGITLSRIRQLYESRFTLINPTEDLIDKCVGAQWYSTPDFWNGGVDDAYTIRADPEATQFHLLIYGELFGQDFAAFLDPNDETAEKHRRLSVETRLEFVKYCIPDFACEAPAERQDDPRRKVLPVGPYAKAADGNGYAEWPSDNNIALTWVLRSNKWRPVWKEMRAMAGDDFGEVDEWWYGPDSGDSTWRQRMWEAVMGCQGLEGLEMMRPGLRDTWQPQVKAWRNQIEKLERDPPFVKIGKQGTYQYPFLLGDLRTCASGYVGGT